MSYCSLSFFLVNLWFFFKFLVVQFVFLWVDDFVVNSCSWVDWWCVHRRRYRFDTFLFFLCFRFRSFIFTSWGRRVRVSFLLDSFLCFRARRVIWGFRLFRIRALKEMIWTILIRVGAFRGLLLVWLFWIGRFIRLVCTIFSLSPVIFRFGRSFLKVLFSLWLVVGSVTSFVGFRPECFTVSH